QQQAQHEGVADHGPAAVRHAPGQIGQGTGGGCHRFSRIRGRSRFWHSGGEPPGTGSGIMAPSSQSVPVMLDPALLRNQTAALAERLATRGFTLDTATLEALESERKEIQKRTQELQNLRNTHSKEIGRLMGAAARHAAAG